MGTISSEISRIEQGKASLKTSIENKGVTVSSSAKIDEYYNYVNSIPGGSTPTVQEKWVNFYDTDGTVLYSYTKEEFLALESLPANPTRTGLVAQGWNWTLAEAKTYLNNNNGCKIAIGQMYKTDDDTTRIYITITDEDLKDINLGVNRPYSIGDPPTVDWGDNTTTTITSEGNTYIPHTYASAGNYIIKISGNLLWFPYTQSSIACSPILSAGGDDYRKYRYLNMITKIEMSGSEPSAGSNYNSRILDYTFAYLKNLKEITIPANATFPDNNGAGVNFIYGASFQYCESLKCLIIPRSTTKIKKNLFKHCDSLQILSLPPTITTIDNYAFQYLSKLRYFTLLISATPASTPTYDPFTQCYVGDNISIPGSYLDKFPLSGILIKYLTITGSITSPKSSQLSSSPLVITNFPATTIPNYCFNDCYYLQKVTAGNVTSIGDYAFQYCYSLMEVDLTSCTAVPTLTNNYVFRYASIDYKIIVPDSLYEEWIVAQYWSNIASHIVKESEA